MFICANDFFTEGKRCGKVIRQTAPEKRGRLLELQCIRLFFLYLSLSIIDEQCIMELVMDTFPLVQRLHGIGRQATTHRSICS